MPQCSLQSCRSYRNPTVFHLDEVVREKWILFCGRESSWRPGPGARLCKAHFTQSCFTTLRRIYLKPVAVPTIKGEPKKFVIKVIIFKLTLLGGALSFLEQLFYKSILDLLLNF